MNRRDLIALLAAGGVAPAVTLPPEQHGEPVFWAVETLDVVQSCWVVVGIYSNKADAIGHLDRLGGYQPADSDAFAIMGAQSGTFALRYSLSQLQYYLAMQRLGPMAEHIAKLMQVPQSPEMQALEAALRRWDQEERQYWHLSTQSTAFGKLIGQLVAAVRRMVG